MSETISEIISKRHIMIEFEKLDATREDRLTTEFIRRLVYEPSYGTKNDIYHVEDWLRSLSTERRTIVFQLLKKANEIVELRKLGNVKEEPDENYDYKAAFEEAERAGLTVFPRVEPEIENPDNFELEQTTIDGFFDENNKTR